MGDVARPDLLGGHHHTQDMASAMWQTLQDKILALPNHVEVYPTHVAGSLCGGAIGSRYSTTIGNERRLNRLLSCISSKERFVTECLDLEGLPAAPPHWRRSRNLNQQGRPCSAVADPPALRVDELARAHDAGAIVVDCRSPEACSNRDLVVLDVRQPHEWASGHIGRARHLTGAQLQQRMGEVPGDRPIAVVCSSGYRSSVAASVLARRGHTTVANVLGGMMAWTRAGFPVVEGK